MYQVHNIVKVNIYKIRIHAVIISEGTLCGLSSGRYKLKNERLNLKSKSKVGVDANIHINTNARCRQYLVCVCKQSLK